MKRPLDTNRKRRKQMSQKSIRILVCLIAIFLLSTLEFPSTVESNDFIQDSADSIISGNDDFKDNRLFGIADNPYISVSESQIDLNEGETVTLHASTVFPDATIGWISNNSSVASVDNNGNVTAIKAYHGTVYITAYVLYNNQLYLDNCYVYVKVKNGSYYLKNGGSNLYLHAGGGVNSLATQMPFSKLLSQRWTIEYISNGQYSIKNVASNLYLGIESMGNLSARATMYTSLNDLSKWYIDRSSSGNYCLYAKCNLSYGYVIGSSTSGYAIAFPIPNLEYSDNSDYCDEWVISLLDFTYDNLYDSSLASNTNLISLISQANYFSNYCYNNLFGISFTSNSNAVQYSNAVADQCSHGINSPCTDTDCGSNCNNHHKNCRNISNQLYDPSLRNVIKIMWTNRSSYTYCHKNDGGVHETVKWIAVVYYQRPVIHFLRISGSNLDIKEACMCLNIVHETAHTFGMTDVYNTPGHDDPNGYHCVMEKFQSSYAYAYYQNILSGIEVPFCTSCLASVDNYVYSSIIN